MAKIETKITTEAQLQTVLVEKKTYILELDENELQTLKFILQRIGGVPNKSPRGYVDSVLQAIDSTGVEIPDGFATDTRTGYVNAIYFADLEQGE